MSQRAALPARRARWLMITGVVGVAAAASSCTTAAGALPHACAAFDRSYARWQAATARSAQPVPQRVAANTTFVSALDHATSEAAGTPLAEVLQAVAATLRSQTSALERHQATKVAAETRAFMITVHVVRETCPGA